MLSYGLKHRVATKPKENGDIFDQINRKELCKDNLNSARLKNTLRAFSFNFLFLVLMINLFTKT